MAGSDGNQTVVGRGVYRLNKFFKYGREIDPKDIHPGMTIQWTRPAKYVSRVVEESTVWPDGTTIKSKGVLHNIPSDAIVVVTNMDSLEAIPHDQVLDYLITRQEKLRDREGNIWGTIAGETGIFGDNQFYNVDLDPVSTQKYAPWFTVQGA